MPKQRRPFGEIDVPTGETFLDPEQQEVDVNQLSTQQKQYLQSQATGRAATGLRQGGQIGTGYGADINALLNEAGLQIAETGDIYSGNLQQRHKFRGLGKESDTRPDTTGFRPGPRAFEQLPEEIINTQQGGEGPGIRSFEGGDPYELTSAPSLRDVSTGLLAPGGLLAGLGKALGMTAGQAVATGITGLKGPALQFALGKAKEAYKAGGLTTETERLAKSRGIDPYSPELKSAVKRAQLSAEDDIQDYAVPQQEVSSEDILAQEARANVKASGFLGNLRNLALNPSSAIQKQQQADLESTEARSLGMTIKEYRKFKRDYGQRQQGDAGIDEPSSQTIDTGTPSLDVEGFDPSQPDISGLRAPDVLSRSDISSEPGYGVATGQGNAGKSTSDPYSGGYFSAFGGSFGDYDVAGAGSDSQGYGIG